MKTTLAAFGILVALLGAVFVFGPQQNDQVAEALTTLPLVPKATQQSGIVRILAVGDMMFDRKIRVVSSQNGADYPFSCIDPLLKEADFAIGNLEGPITDSVSISVGSLPGSFDNYFFTFPTTTAQVLARHNFKAVGIGNNHILNFGYAGLISTQEYLSQAGVGYFGGVNANEGIFETEVNNVSLAFVGYNEFGGGSVADVVNNIKKEHDAGRVVIVYSHWGDEYVDASPRLRPVAEMFAEAGASAVIGMHPHVVLGHEYIGDTLVYYSLGNFIFDQYFSDDVDHGLSLILTVTKDGHVTAAEHPVVLNRDGTTCEEVQ